MDTAMTNHPGMGRNRGDSVLSKLSVVSDISFDNENTNDIDLNC